MILTQGESQEPDSFQNLNLKNFVRSPWLTLYNGMHALIVLLVLFTSYF